jgi:hypothetical protein
MSKPLTKKNPFDTSNDEEEIPGVDSPVDTNTQFTFEANSLQQNPEDLIKKGLKNSGIPEEAVKAGLKIGEQIIKDSQSKFIDYFSLDGLKPYFNVTNKYVLLKLCYIILPFLYKIDSTLTVQQNLKIETPDLYIPLMSFITYVLLIGFNSAYQQQKIFEPEILGKIASKNAFILFFQVALLKLTMFIFSNIQIPFLDVLCFIGYKMVLIVLVVIIWILFPIVGFIYFLITLISILSMIFFTKCLKMRISQDSNSQKILVYLASTLEIVTILLILLDLYIYSS